MPKFKLDEFANIGSMNIESIMVKRSFICKKCGASFERTLPRFTSIYPLCDKCMGLKVQEKPIILSCTERNLCTCQRIIESKRIC